MFAIHMLPLALSVFCSSNRALSSCTLLLYCCPHHADSFHRFSQADVHEFAPALIDALLRKVEQGSSPEKVAENDYLMKCTFKSIIVCYPNILLIYN